MFVFWVVIIERYDEVFVLNIFKIEVVFWI